MVSRGSRIRSSIASLVGLAFSACLLGSVPGLGQKIENAISGTITSASGSRVPNALVSAKSINTGEVKTVTASEDGTYRLFGLPRGAYEIRASAPDFAVASATVTVTENSSLVVNLVLQAEVPRA